MTLNLNLCAPFVTNFSTPSFVKTNETSPKNSTSTVEVLSFLVAAKKPTRVRGCRVEASLSESENGVVAEEIVDEELLSRVSVAKAESEVLEMVAEKSKRSGGVLSVNDCRLIINAAMARGNPDLALSVFYAMRSSFDQGSRENIIDRWMWSRPDVSVYTSLVQDLAASLKVSDALRLIQDICRIGVSPSEEVPFGKVVRCPTCLLAVAVAQPQHGIQIVSCAKCRYKYELVSGDIVSIDSEEIRNYSCRTQHGYSSMEKGANIPANIEAEHPCCRSFYSGSNSFWHSSDTQVCN